MTTDILYEYYGREKNDLETSVMPFIILQKIESDIHVIIISDGLCKLYATDRAQVAYTIENGIFTTVHPEDAEKVSAAMAKFFAEGTLNLVFRKRIGSGFRSIFAQGSSFLTDSGEKLHTIWCGDVTDIVNAEKINTYYDKLTTLPNMSAFGVLAEQERRRMILVMANLLRTTGISENEMIDRIADSTGISEEEAFFYVYGDADSQVKDTEEDK